MDVNEELKFFLGGGGSGGQWEGTGGQWEGSGLGGGGGQGGCERRIEVFVKIQKKNFGGGGPVGGGWGGWGGRGRIGGSEWM